MFPLISLCCCKLYHDVIGSSFYFSDSMTLQASIRNPWLAFFLVWLPATLPRGSSGSTISTNRYMIKSTLKIARYCPLVNQAFSYFLGLFQVIMANPDLEMNGKVELLKWQPNTNRSCVCFLPGWKILVSASLTIWSTRRIQKKSTSHPGHRVNGSIHKDLQRWLIESLDDFMYINSLSMNSKISHFIYSQKSLCLDVVFNMYLPWNSHNMFRAKAPKSSIFLCGYPLGSTPPPNPGFNRHHQDDMKQNIC